MKVPTFVLCASILVLLVVAQVQAKTYQVNEDPMWDLCVNGGDMFSCTGHGSCQGGKCVCTDGYTGRDCSLPPGVTSFASNNITVTQFCQLETGGCAAGMCVGGGQFDTTNLPYAKGKRVDGVAALNPTLYGSRYAYVNSPGAGNGRTPNGYYSFVGQSCGTCWELKRKSVTITVVVVDRCAGYCRATAGVGTNQQCDSNGPTSKECGECIQSNHTSVPQCSCLTNPKENHGMCDGNPAAHCDWCANNDHPHFDLDITAQMKICAEAGGDGFCFLDSFQLVDCGPMQGEWPNGYYNGTDSPASLAKKLATTGSNSNNANANANTNSVVSNSACGISTAGGVCQAVADGGYWCNGANLSTCNLGTMKSVGCPAGTKCQSGRCDFFDVSDPVFTPCSLTSSSTQSPATQAPPATQATTRPTSAPPVTQATTRPTPAPTPAPTSAPTSAPTTAAPTSAPTTAAPTSAPATPTVSANHPCRSKKRRSAQEEEELVAEAEEIVKSYIQTETAIVQMPEAIKPVESSANSVIATFVAAANLFLVVFIALYL